MPTKGREPRVVDDLSVARRSLEIFRAEGVTDFDSVWKLTVGALAVREVFSPPEQRDHDHAIAALLALEDTWRACYLGTPEPRGKHWRVGSASSGRQATPTA